MGRENFFINLVAALGGATIGSIIAARLGQSVVIGYILAGVVIGPYTPGFVGNVATVEALADIGVVLLLFAIGVQLSFRELMAVGRLAIVGGAIQVVLMIAIGYAAGTLWGWGPIEALFLGAVISNSSSTVLTKILGERGELDSWHGRVGLAWSTVQDFSTVLLVVLLSSIGRGEAIDFGEVIWATLKVVLFLALVVPIGMYVFPRLLERVTALRSREVFVLTVAVVAMGTAFLASLFGISLALGAFVAGIVVGESDLSHQILGEMTPIRDVFAGLFFVSIGMLVDPRAAFEQSGPLLGTILLIMVVKSLLSAGITVIAGYAVRPAILTGITLGQSAEFSFLLARVGSDIGAVGSAAFSVMLTGSVISIILSPFLHRAGPMIARWAGDHLPAPARRQIATPIVEKEALRGHAVICGFGRVGQMIASALERRQLKWVAIDEDQRLVDRFRKRGEAVLFGNAANRVLLDQVNLGRARVLIIAVPDPVAARQVLDYARDVNPNLNIVVRTHSTAERDWLEQSGANLALVGELELALEMTRHTLLRFGVTNQEAQAIVQGLRARAPREAD